MDDSGLQAMLTELGALLDRARIGELTSADFVDDLTAIHARFLGDEFDAPSRVRGREQALAAYRRLETGLERHHQIEQLALALGLDP